MEDDDEAKSEEDVEEIKVDEDETSIGDYIPPKYRSCRWNNSTGRLPKDQFYTPQEAIKPILSFIEQFKDKVVFEPCAGEGHIAKFLESNGFQNVIQRDLYTLPEHHDYLDNNIPTPDYDLLITNPPFCSKYEFLIKAYASTKPFAFLLPLDTLFTLSGYNIFKDHPVFVGAFYRRIHFLNPKGKTYSTTNVGWFFGNCDKDLINKHPSLNIIYLDTEKI